MHSSNQKSLFTRKYLAGIIALAVAYAIYHFLGKQGDFFIYKNQSEMALYFRTSQYIQLFWAGLFGSEASFIEWLYNFVFHLSPNGFTEKPLYSFMLGYFRLFLKGLGLDTASSDSIYNHLLTITISLAALRYFIKKNDGLTGLLIGSFILSFPILTYVDSMGYHTTSGLFLFLFSLMLIGRARPLYLTEGLLLGLSFFASQHLAILATAAFGIRLLYLLFTGAKGERKAVLSRYLAGFILPFAYFLLRDFAESLKHLEYLSPPGLFEYASHFKRNSNFIYEAFTQSATDAVDQNVPFDPLYLFGLLKILYPMVHYLWYLILPTVFIITKGRDIAKRQQKGGGGEGLFNQLELSISFILLGLIVSALAHTTLGLVAIPRAFTPYVVLLFILEFLLLRWVVVRAGKKAASYKKAAYLLTFAAGILFFSFNTYYTSTIISSKSTNDSYLKKIAKSENAIRPSHIFLNKPGNKFDVFYRFVKEAQVKGYDKVILPAMLIFVQQSRLSDEDMLCAVAVLKDRVKTVEKIEIFDPKTDRGLAMAMNEHAYYRFYKGVYSGKGQLGSELDLKLSRLLSYRHEYIFKTDELIEVMEENGSAMLTQYPCEIVYRSKGL